MANFKDALKWLRWNAQWCSYFYTASNKNGNHGCVANAKSTHNVQCVRVDSNQGTISVAPRAPGGSEINPNSDSFSVV